jgi:hypothetical protein
VGVDIEHKEDLCDFRGLVGSTRAMATHLAFAVAAHAMRIDSQNATRKMAAGETHFGQGDLEILGLRDGVFVQEFVHSDITGQKGKPIGQFEALLTQGAALADAGGTKGCFMHELQGETRLDAFGGLSGPALQQVPGSQTEMFGDQEPETDQVAADLVGQELTHAAFDAERIARLGPGACGGALGLERWFGFRTVAIEFFFVSRTLR